MKLKIKIGFAWAHFGHQIAHYEAGATVETDDADMIAVATREGWAVPADQPDGKARKAAPENKSKGGAE